MKGTETTRLLSLVLGLVIAVVTVAAVPSGCAEEPATGALDDRLRALIEAMLTSYPAGDHRYLRADCRQARCERPMPMPVLAAYRHCCYHLDP